MSLPTIEKDGFFEGTYDHEFVHRGIDVPHDRLDSYLPRLSRWDIGHARPLLFEFPEGVGDHLGRLALPYRQTNQLVQIGLQYDREGRKPVPDGYMVRYSRLGQFAGSDIHKSLTVKVLRSEVAEEMADTDLGDRTNMDYLHWLEVAVQGQRFGNAVLAFSTTRHSYTSLISRTTKSSGSPRLMPADDKLAEETFKTVVYWES